MLKENLRTLALVVAGSIVGSFVGCVVTVRIYEARLESQIQSIFGGVPTAAERDEAGRKYEQEKRELLDSLPKQHR